MAKRKKQGTGSENLDRSIADIDREMAEADDAFSEPAVARIRAQGYETKTESESEVGEFSLTDADAPDVEDTDEDSSVATSAELNPEQAQEEERIRRLMEESDEAFDEPAVRALRASVSGVPATNPNQELPPVPAGLEKDATAKAEMDVAKEMYLTQLESGQKWGETHNLLRKKYTETLGTYIETQRLLAETEARIRYGNQERERGVDENSVIQNAECFDEFLENDAKYKAKIEELTRVLERTEVDFRDKDSSFDPAAALLGDTKLMMSFEPYLSQAQGPLKPVFEGMQKPVLSYEEEKMIGEELVLKFYIARTEYFSAYHAYHMGHASRDFFRRQAIVYKRLREDVTNALMRQGRAIDIYQEDPKMENLIKQYWLSGFKKGRVSKTAEKVRTQKKGKIGRTITAVLAFFAAWSHDPNAPQEPSVRYEDTRGQAPEPRRAPQRVEAPQDVSTSHVFETPFAQEVPEGRGAISTLRMLLSRMTPQMREAIYQGIEQNKNGGMTEEDYRLLRNVRENPDRYADGAQLLARQLGFVKEDSSTEPTIPLGTRFVFDQDGFYLEHEGSRTQLLNAQFEVVATYENE